MQINYSLKYIERFWRKVDKTSSTLLYNGVICWIWIGGIRSSNGYGAVVMGDRKKILLAHRVSWVLTFGDIPDNLHVLHKCDNTSCVNPDHLFLGTHKDNMDDRDQKNRQPSGEKNGMHKLTDEQVSEIRRRYAGWGKGGDSARSLAKEFGVRHSQISRIVNHKSRV